MISDHALRSPVAIAFEKMAAEEELTDQEQAIVADLDGATPEEVREALDATGAKRRPAFMVKMRIGPPGGEY